MSGKLKLPDYIPSDDNIESRRDQLKKSYQSSGVDFEELEAKARWTVAGEIEEGDRICEYMVNEILEQHQQDIIESAKELSTIGTQQDLYASSREAQGTSRDENQRSWELDDLVEMGAREFEKLIAGVYSQMGFETTLTQRSRDGGVDIWAKRDDHTIAVEAKCYKKGNKVGVKPIREAAHSLLNKADKSVIVTTADFTKGSLS